MKHEDSMYCTRQVRAEASPTQKNELRSIECTYIELYSVFISQPVLLLRKMCQIQLYQKRQMQHTRKRRFSILQEYPVLNK